MPLTISAIKADVGSVGGHTQPSSTMMETTREHLRRAKGDGTVADFHTWFTGDDIALLMVHEKGKDHEEIHGLAWSTFEAATEVAKSENLYGAGQDLLEEAHTGNIHGLGPGVAEMEIEVRPGESFLSFACDKTEPGAFNLPLYLSFVDPMNTGGLILKPNLKKGFTFHVMDVEPHADGRVIQLNTPEEIYNLAALLRDDHRFVVERIVSRHNADEQVVAASTSRLHNIAGKYVGKDDPIMTVRVQQDFPAPEEVTQAFTRAHYVGGNTRGSHNMPLMPVAANVSAATNFCIPMVSCLAFSVTEQGQLSEPVDYFGHDCFDHVREKAYRKAEEIRMQGFAGPAMLPIQELEYGGITETLDELEGRFGKPVD